jgi:hypothetical protein
MSFFRQLLEIYSIPIFSKRKLLKKLRSDWLEPVQKWRDFSKIETFLKLAEGHHKQGIIDDKTWHDLGMNAIFNKIDTTLTEVGQTFFVVRRIRLFCTIIYYKINAAD